MSKKFQIVVSEEEYDYLQQKSKEKGISVSQYVHDEIFKANAFEEKWRKVLERLEKYPEGIEFDISMLVGYNDWNAYDRSTKLSLARTLNRQVIAGELKGILIAGKSASNVTVYIKEK